MFSKLYIHVEGNYRVLSERNLYMRIVRLYPNNVKYLNNIIK